MEDAPPGVEAEHRDVCVGGVACVEGSSEHGARAEKRERLGGDHSAPQPRHPVACQHDSGQAGHRNGIRQRRRARAPLEKIRISHAALPHAAASVWNILDDAHESIAARERERLQQNCVHHAVDRRRRADAECERGDGDGREAGRPSQRPDRVADVVHLRLEIRCHVHVDFHRTRVQQRRAELPLTHGFDGCVIELWIHA